MMKSLLLNGIFLIYMYAAVSQNSVRLQDASPIVSTDSRWKLNEYVWSHGHPKPAKNDKPVLDFEAIDNWSSLSSEVLSISPNGIYFLYGIQNNLLRRLDSVIVQSTMDKWRTALSSDAQSGFFSADSRHYIYQQKGTLRFLKTGMDEQVSKNIIDYQKNNRNEWLAYRLDDADTTLIVDNLLNGKSTQFHSVTSYAFDETGNWLVYQLRNKQVVLRNLISGNETMFSDLISYKFHPSGKWFVGKLDGASSSLMLQNLISDKKIGYSNVKSYWLNSSGDIMLISTNKGLEYVELLDGREKLIWSMKDKDLMVQNVFFDKLSKQVVFVTEDKSKQVAGSDTLAPFRCVWHWRVGMNEAEQKFNTPMPGFEKSIINQNGISFSDDGRYLWFKLASVKPTPAKPLPGAIQLDVWSYQDKILQSAQPSQKEINERSLILNLENGRIVFQEREYEKLEDINGDYAFGYKRNKGKYGDRFWEKGYYEDSVWLIDLRRGLRYRLPTQSSTGGGALTFSPDGRYLIYFDAANGCNYFSYELATGKIINISAGIPTWQLGITQPFVRTTEKPSGGSSIIKRLSERNAFLVRDNFGDIWQLDFNGKKTPICITNSLGRMQNITFHLLNPDIKTDTLLLAAYNRRNKMQGYYKKVLGTKNVPELLSMNSFAMGISRYKADYLLKAQDTNTWIVKCENATLAPNYFVTHDLKKFTQLTCLEPHKKYNWLTAELHSFKQLDGTLSQGVLYKPENFDPSKKYPLIISFYVNLSDQLFHYPNANYIECPAIFNAPAWMVSHGYLVFIPDIYFTKNQWGPSTVNTIDGAAHYLAKLPYVNGNHMGAAGHSNSGRFGYYLLTHSRSFAAMSVGAGATNILNLSLSLEAKKSMLMWAEVESVGTGLGNIWKRKESWIDQTSVLQADKVTSPLLLFHNKKDGVPIEQAEQMFIALRRLEKKCWWLQYDNGHHTVWGDDARDWTIRYTQFFDHYLKGAPAPRWMTRGISAAKKKIELGYELDPEGSCIMKGKGGCHVCGN